MSEKRTFGCNQCDTRITEGEDVWGLCEPCASKVDWDALTGGIPSNQKYFLLEPNLTIETIKLDGAREDVGSELAEGKVNIICDIDGTIADVRHRLQFI